MTEDERFLRDGSDLISVVDVPAPAAALGTTVTVPTLDGDEEIEVEPGTQPGTVVTLRGRGMPPIGRGRSRRPAGGAQRGDPAQPHRAPARAAGGAARQRDRGQPARGRRASRCCPRSAGRCADPAGGAGARRARPRRCWPRCSSWRPAGVEQVDDGDFVEFAVYGAPGELPELARGRGRGGRRARGRQRHRGARRLGGALEALPLAGAGGRPPLGAPAVGAGRGPRPA